MKHTLLVGLFLYMAASANGKILSAMEVMKETYKGSQYLGFAVGNHSSIKALEDLKNFLSEVAKNDLEFRYVYLESPAELAQGLEDLSTNKVSLEEIESSLGSYWYERIKASDQLIYFYTEVLEEIQKINKGRSEAPIIVVPIDSYNKQRNQSDTERLKAGGNFYLFGGSIAREVETAENFLNHVILHPYKRGAIFYHQAHILKSLVAHGYILDDAGVPEFFTSQHLGWWSFAEETLPVLRDKMKVILFNEKDDRFNPSSVIDSSLFLPDSFKQSLGLVLSDEKIKSLDLFVPDSYLFRYRGATVVFPENAKSVLDAFISYE